MSLYALCVFALIGAAIAQQNQTSAVVPSSNDDKVTTKKSQPSIKLSTFEDDDVTTKKNYPSLILPAFEDDDDDSDNNTRAVTNAVLPTFEDDNETDNSNFGESSFGDANDNEISHGFPTLPESATPVEIVQENTEDLSVEVTTASSVATQTQSQRPSGLSGIFDIFGNAVHEVVNENANNFNKGVDAVLGVGQSFIHAANDIREGKMIAAASIPRGWYKFFKALENQRNF